MSTPNPHDHFFRTSFERLETARNYLQEYAPPELVAQLDLSQMALQNGTFIDDDMREHQTDLLYQVPLVNGELAFVYFLFEHKSYPDPLVAYQLLRYQVRIWERQLQEEKQLSPIIPLVIYHGERPWRIATDFASLLVKDEAMLDTLRPHLPRFVYELRDFSHLSSEEIRGELWLRATLATLRSIFDPNLHAQLPHLIELIFALEEERRGLDYIRLVLYYLTVATEKVSREELQQAMLTQGSRGEQLMGTIAQEYIREGIQIGLEQGLEKGLEQGLEKGLEQGKLNALRENIAELLAVRLDVPQETYREVLAEIDEAIVLRRLFSIAATAETIAVFDAELPT